MHSLNESEKGLCGPPDAIIDLLIVQSEKCDFDF